MNRERVAEHLLLPEDEEWSAKTWAHFRYRILRHLRKSGARTVPELEAEGIEMLLLPLSRTELIAVLESSRRQGLVEPSPHGVSATGAPTGGEWQITARGRSAARSPVEWVISSLGKSVRLLPAVVALLTAIGLSAVIAKDLAKISWLTAVLVGFATIYSILMLLMACAWLWSRSHGATTGFLIAGEWARFGEECPERCSKLEVPLPKRLTVLLIALTLIAFVASFFVEGWPGVVVAVTFMGSFFSLLYVVSHWYEDRYEWYWKAVKINQNETSPGAPRART